MCVVGAPLAYKEEIHQSCVGCNGAATDPPTVKGACWTALNGYWVFSSRLNVDLEGQELLKARESACKCPKHSPKALY
jgi:hypothetical protein